MDKAGIMIKYIGSECSIFIEMDREKVIDMVSYFATNAQIMYVYSKYYS